MKEGGHSEDKKKKKKKDCTGITAMGLCWDIPGALLGAIGALVLAVISQETFLTLFSKPSLHVLGSILLLLWLNITLHKVPRDTMEH